MSDPTLLSAAELVQRYRSGELSPVEVLQRTFARIDALNDELLIFTWQDRQRALAEAAEAERRYRAGEDTPPLLGVAFSVKEQIPVAGQPQSFGSRLFKEHRASADDPSVQRLRSAGAILLGGTNMPEFGTSATCANPVFGTSRNPWDASRTPGGSSGGAAAAVAAGLGVIALGTDIAGSVRIPASCCGVVGVKATLGAIPQVHAADLFNALGHLGPLTRSVEDAALALELLIGPDPRDPWSLGLAKQNLRDAARADGDLRSLRIGWLPQVGLGLPDAQVLAACSAAAEKLRGAGAEVIEVSLDLSDSGQTFANIVLPLKRHFLGERYPAEAEQLSPNFRGWLEASYPKLDAEILLATQFARSRLFHRVQTLFEQVDVLLTPTLSAPPVAAEGPAELDWIHYLPPFNLSGHPAFSLPAGLSTEGWPIGLQLVGPWHSEARLLRLAAHWQALNPWGSPTLP